MTKKKRTNPHKRPFSIEVIENHPENTILFKVAIDLGFRTSGLAFLEMDSGNIECLNYKKKEDCQVQGMKIVDLLNLCKSTIKEYVSLLPQNIKTNLNATQFILEEPLIITGQRSFSISLYILLSQLIEYFIKILDVHSVCLVIPGSAKKLLGWSPREHMPDKEKTQFIKQALGDIKCTNNHCADAVFSLILTNQELLKNRYSSLRVLKDLPYEIYKSRLNIF